MLDGMRQLQTNKTMLIFVDNQTYNAANTCERLRLTGHTLITAAVERDWKTIIDRCDAVVVSGVGGIGNYALEANIPVFLNSDDLDIPLNPTEVASPVQARRFLQIVMAAYHLHLKKNQDYSKANINGTGEAGIAVRLWDKGARLANLYGFDVTIEPQRFGEISSVVALCNVIFKNLEKYGVKPNVTGVTTGEARQAQNESVQDTLIDAMVYSIIAMLYGEGSWGK